MSIKFLVFKILNRYADWLQPPAQAGSSLADSFTMKVEAICSSDTMVDTRSTRHHIPDDGILHSHRRENLRSYMLKYFNWI
jgi:hypothetical protein